MADKEKPAMQIMTLSPSFSKKHLIFYKCLRMANSVLIASTTLFYSHFYLLRSDEDKGHSYFERKANTNTNTNANSTTPHQPSYLYMSRPRHLCNQLTAYSVLVCVASNLLLKLKKRALTQLLHAIKASHAAPQPQPLAAPQIADADHAAPVLPSQPALFLSRSDLRLLSEWKCTVGGTKHYVGSLDLCLLSMLYLASKSETTIFGFYRALTAEDDAHQQQLELETHSASRHSPSDWQSRYYQYADEKQEISWPHAQQLPEMASAPSSDRLSIDWVMNKVVLCYGFLPSLVLSASTFPVTALWYSYATS